MSGYSKQLIAELSEHLDDNIIAFFRDNSEQYGFKEESINELVEAALEKCYKGKTTKQDLRDIHAKEIANRSRKKKRWFEKLEYEYKGYPLSDARNPFFLLYNQTLVLDKKQWNLLYKGKTLEELAEERMADARAWVKQSDSLFVDFPGIKSQTPNRIYESILSDTAISIYIYIGESYDGSIENYFLPFPTELITIPLFAPKKILLSVTADKDDSIVEKHEFGENNILETSASLQNVSGQLNSMDQNDLKIFYCSLQNLDPDFYITKQAHVKKSDLVKALYSGRPGKKVYDSMEEHCHRLSRYNYKVTSNGKTKVSFNLIDYVDTTSPDEVIFTFGSILYNGIIDNEITNIKSSNMQLLKNNLSTILYQSLFRERIILSTKNASEEEELVQDYPFSFFSLSVRFPKQTQKKNMDMIEASLTEFVENHIVVKSFERKASSHFRIHFYPLSPDERADLTLNRYKNIVAIPQDMENVVDADNIIESD